MTRRLLSLAVATLALLACLGLAAGSAAAQADGQGSEQTTSTAIATTTELDSAPPTPPSMLVLPNSGVAPKSATDRGGWAQYAVLGGITLALATIIFFISRESRAAKRRRAG